ncbi:hypothetical protein [Paenibacillus sp. GCM10028914]|uniref:hypothetical protein n=1 Tax=Paenibacillus sp. GCM10028914 TaxID=3273416 RepID=UPI00360DC6B0
MIIKILSIALLSFNLNLFHPDQPSVQIFDVKQEKVIQERPLTQELEKSIITLLQSSPTIHGGLSIDPKDGQILHVKFKNPVKLSSDIYPDLIKEVYLFLEHGVRPKALIFFNNTAKNIVVVLEGHSEQFIKKNILR